MSVSLSWILGLAINTYLLLDIVKRIGRVDSKADQDNVRIGVRQGTETIVVFLASRIPKGQLDVLAIDLNVGDVVLENSGDVDLKELNLSAWIHFPLHMRSRN